MDSVHWTVYGLARTLWCSLIITQNSAGHVRIWTSDHTNKTAWALLQTLSSLQLAIHFINDESSSLSVQLQTNNLRIDYKCCSQQAYPNPHQVISDFIFVNVSQQRPPRGLIITSSWSWLWSWFLIRCLKLSPTWPLCVFFFNLI